jgi:hypothetical protein
MHPPNRRSPALRRSHRPVLWLPSILLSASTTLFFGCAGMNSSVGHVFGSSSAATPPQNATPAQIATPSPAPTPAAGQPRAHQKSASEVRIAAEKASQASETAAEASRKALQASKQARAAANAASQAENDSPGAGSHKGTVSLEASPIPSSGSTPDAGVAMAEVPEPTPAARLKGTPDLERRSTATASLPAVASSGEPNPADTAKLIDDVNKLEKQIDRNNLSADESQRDILAQRLLTDARKALADHDDVAATSLASKASTLLAPLPKIPGPVIPSMR